MRKGKEMGLSLGLSQPLPPHNLSVAPPPPGTFSGTVWGWTPQTVLLGFSPFLWDRWGMGLQPKPAQPVAANKMSLHERGEYRYVKEYLEFRARGESERKLLWQTL